MITIIIEKALVFTSGGNKEGEGSAYVLDENARCFNLVCKTDKMWKCLKEHADKSRRVTIRGEYVPVNVPEEGNPFTIAWHIEVSSISYIEEGCPAGYQVLGVDREGEISLNDAVYRPQPPLFYHKPCPKCGGRLLDQGIVMTSLPPQTPYKCEACGHIHTVRGIMTDLEIKNNLC